MPMLSRNIIMRINPDSYCHVCARGVNDRNIFIDDGDYDFFLSLFDRYFSKQKPNEKYDSKYKKLNDAVEIVAYCLSDKSFHLLIHQKKANGISVLMRNSMDDYTRYFNSKHNKSARLFDKDYHASCINSDEYLLHVSRYIHLNPKNWMDYPYSSLRAYLYNDAPSWLNKVPVCKKYGSAVKYLESLNEEKEMSESLLMN